MKRELQKTKKEVRKAKAEPEKWSTPKRLAELKAKKPFLQMKLAALENAADELIAAQTKLRDLLNEDLRDYFQKMRGLLAYSIACGRTNPDCKLLFDSLGDYLEAESESDRKAAHKAVNSVWRGNFDSTEREIRRRRRPLARESRMCPCRAYVVHVLMPARPSSSKHVPFIGLSIDH